MGWLSKPPTYYLPMGFNGRAKREAKAREAAAFNSMQASASFADQARRDYLANFATRNAELIGLQERAFGRIKGFETGKDVGQLYAGLSSRLSAGADVVRNAQRLTSGMGTNALAQQDSRYMAKLQNVANRQIASQLGRSMAEGATALYGQDLQTGMATSQFLNADRQAGMQAVGQSVADFGSLGNFASRIRGTEIAQGQAMFNNLMSVGQFGLGVAGMFSDVRLKSKIVNSVYGLAEVLKLNPVQYIIKGRREVGFIAQEVEKIMPEFVRDTVLGYKTVNYGLMVAVMAKAIQELHEEVEKLKRKENIFVRFIKKLIK